MSDIVISENTQIDLTSPQVEFYHQETRSMQFSSLRIA